VALVFRRNLDRPRNRIDKCHELPEFLAGEVRLLAAILSSQRLGLLHERIAEAQLVGAGGGHELLERGKLGFPAKLAETPARQGARAAGPRRAEIAAELAAQFARHTASMVKANRRFRQAVDQAVA